jgi:hypothetical protein
MFWILLLAFIFLTAFWLHYPLSSFVFPALKVLKGTFKKRMH